MHFSNQPSAVIVTLSPDDLAAMIRSSLRAVLDEEPAPPVNGQSPDPGAYLTREETCDLLHISLVTLRKYEKRGELLPCRFGRRVLYRKTDVDAALARSRGG